jgi:hypothetical protein
LFLGLVKIWVKSHACRVRASTDYTMQLSVLGASQGQRRELCLATGQEHEHDMVVADIDTRAMCRTPCGLGGSDACVYV